MSSTSISLVVVPSDVAQLTEEGTKALFSASLNRAQVNTASVSGDNQGQNAQQQQTDQMLINKLLFCACSVACEMATATADNGGKMLTPVSKDSTISRRVSKDTHALAEDGSCILFSFPVQEGNFLLAMQVPQELFSLFGGATLVNMFLQTLSSREIGADEINSHHGEPPGSPSRDAGSPSAAPSSSSFAESIKTELGALHLQRRIHALMQALLLLVFPLEAMTQGGNRSDAGDVEISTAPSRPNTARELAGQIAKMARETGVLPQNASLALATIHPQLSDAIAGLVPRASPVCCSLRNLSSDFRFVERGVALWERGRLIYFTGTRDSFAEHMLPCALLAVLSAGKGRSMPLFRLPRHRFSRSTKLPSVVPGEQGYIVPPDDDDRKKAEIVQNVEYCMVGVFGNLTVAIILKPTLTPYNGTPLDVIHAGLVSFLIAQSKSTLDGAGRWPRLLQDAIEDLSLPPAHPLSACHRQVQNVLAMRAVYISHRTASSAIPILCVASPSISNASVPMKRWVLQSSARRGTKPSFSCVKRPAQKSTEGYATFVVAARSPYRDYRKGSSVGRSVVTTIAVEAGYNVTPAQMHALIHYLASKSW